MRLLLFNLATDTSDPVLGFTSQWINAIARRVEWIHVITMRAGEIEVARNVTVHSLGKERGYSEPRRAVNFYRHLFQVLQDDVQVCFSHMAPLFSALAAPLLKVRGIPILTWYAHRQVTPVLKLAHHLSDCMLASAPGAYRYKHDKLVVLGQGIDTDLFSPAGSCAIAEPCVVSVGRISPIKNLETLLRAVATLRRRGWAIRCRLIGEPSPRDLDYARGLAAIVTELSLEHAVEFVGPVRLGELPERYRMAFAHVNLCPSGALDKAALEAMSCGRPSLVANTSFSELLGQWKDHLLFEHGGAAGLADKIEDLLRMNPAERRRMEEDLRRGVVAHHGLERLSAALVKCFHESCAA